MEKESSSALGWVWLAVGGEPTRLSNPQDFTEDERELDAAPGKRTLVFILSAAVLQNKLQQIKQIFHFFIYHKAASYKHA